MALKRRLGWALFGFLCFVLAMLPTAWLAESVPDRQTVPTRTYTPTPTIPGAATATPTPNATPTIAPSLTPPRPTEPPATPGETAAATALPTTTPEPAPTVRPSETPVPAGTPLAPATSPATPAQPPSETPTATPATLLPGTAGSRAETSPAVPTRTETTRLAASPQVAKGTPAPDAAQPPAPPLPWLCLGGALLVLVGLVLWVVLRRRR